MKKIVFILALTMVVGTGAKATPPVYNLHTISIQTFYDELTPYGEWIESPDYGFVWRPYLEYGDDFKPYYTHGNWVYTDFGWTWVSGYPWGWATFHYGRWFFDDYLGWMWIPGNQWAPAWVTWGSYDNCWAWAPMGPAVNIGMRVAWTAPQFWWTFVPMNRFYSRHWHHHCYSPPVHITNITIINNVYYDRNPRNHGGSWYYGPRVNEVEKHAGTRVQRMRTVETSRPGALAVKNGRVDIYRPEVRNERTDLKPGDYRSVESARSGRAQDRSIQGTSLNRKEEQARPRVEDRNIKQEVRNSVGRIVHPSPVSTRTRDENQRITAPPVETRQSPPARVQGGSTARHEQAGRENNAGNQRFNTSPVETRQSPPARVQGGSTARHETLNRQTVNDRGRQVNATGETRRHPVTGTNNVTLKRQNSGSGSSGEIRKASGDRKTIATPAGSAETKSQRGAGQQQRRAGGAN